MPDESCRKCGTRLNEYVKCRDCNTVFQLICNSCNEKTIPRFHCCTLLNL